MPKHRFEYRDMPASERPKKLYEYWVTGIRGNFPTDMLRYDSCWPADPVSAELVAIERTDNNQVSIRMRSYEVPTIERWSSFQWSVGTEKLS